MRPGGRGGRGHALAAGLLFSFPGVGLAGCASPAAAPPLSVDRPAGPAAPSAAEEVAASFTDEQADRGQRVFTTVCSVCHGRNEFSGPIFEITWMAEPVGHLFQHISTAMPQDRPGSLSPEEYAAVLAYLLQLNGRRAGDRELPPDAEVLGRMRW
ncbi:MAG TPA: cytochrome c [Longimicrobiales bacterium]|nr:cytochrome c [Longimicrobiales bacterium]